MGLYKKNKDIKDKDGKAMYSVTGHDAVTSMIHPLLVRWGVNVIPSMENITQEGNRTTAYMSFDFINIDNPEDRFTRKWFSYGIDYSDKGPGKAASYAQRYVILKVLHIETGDADLEDEDIEFDNDDPASTATTPSDNGTPKKRKKKVEKDISIPSRVAVSEKQGKFIYALFMGRGFGSKEVGEYLFERYGVRKTNCIPRDKSVELIDALKAGSVKPKNPIKAEEVEEVPFNLTR